MTQIIILELMKLALLCVIVYFSHSTNSLVLKHHNKGVDELRKAQRAVRDLRSRLGLPPETL